MIIPILKFCHKSTLVFIEIGAVLILIFLGLMGFVFWKFSQGPVEITFAADAVKRAIVASEHKTDLQFDSIVAEWPKFTGPVSIGLSGLKLIEGGKPVMNIPQMGIRIAKTPLLFGMVKPEAIVVKNATIKLLRSKTGGVHLLLSDNEAIVKEEAESGKDTVVSGIKSLGEAMFKGGNLPDYRQIQPLSKMERFSVDNAHVVIVDEETGKGWDIPKLDFELLRQPDEFTVDARYGDDPNNITHFSFLLERDLEADSIRFYSLVDNINASVLGRLFLPVQPAHGPQFIVAGQVEGELDKDWNLESLDGEILSRQGDLNLNGLYKTPLKFSNLAAYISYDRASQKIVLHDTHIDINNRTLELSGEKMTGQNSSIFAMNISIPEITFDEIHAMWPDNQKDTLAAEWLTKKLNKAKVSDLQLVIPIDIKKPDDLDTTKISANFSFENLTADYRAPLVPVTEAKGRATLKDDVLSIDVSSGKLADMVIKKGNVTITHLTHPTTVGDAIINADVSGNVSTILDYIGREPINLGEKVGLDPKKVTGTTDLTVHVSFPALADLPAEDVKVVADAGIQNIFLPAVVRGMDLTGGPFHVAVKDGKVVFDGKGSLGGQAIDLVYTAYLDLSTAPYVSEIKADVVAGRDLREKFGVHLDQFVEGNVPVSILYQEEKGGDEKVAVNADVTPVIVKFSPFKYIKPVGKAGKANCNVLIRNGEVQTIRDLQLSIDKGGSASGKIDFGKVGDTHDVKSGKFSSFTMAGANNFALDFTQTSPNVFDIQIKGKQLDGRPFLGHGERRKDAKENGTPTAVNAIVEVTRIKTGSGNDQILTSPVLSLKTNPVGDVTFLDLRGNFEGGKISVSLKPDAKGIMQMAISSDNAGSALRTLDIYDQMIGGTMDIRGSQIKGGQVNDIRGFAQIKNFTVVRAPVLAKLINLFSLSGLTELLQNKGIGFTKLNSEFEWRETKSGRVIAVKNGKTSGASIGLTFGGNINQDTGTMDISGTFVPMSQINGFFGKIPLIGGLLTGGKDGAVIAATYAMSGKTEDPSVFVNPLSVLTPGFLRSFLFESDRTVFSEDEEDAKPAVKKGYNN